MGQDSPICRRELGKRNFKASQRSPVFFGPGIAGRKQAGWGWLGWADPSPMGGGPQGEG